MKETISYLINFLVGFADKDYSSIVGYTSDEAEFAAYKVIIIPSGFFDSDNYGRESSLPQTPLKKFNDIPILFGENKIEKKGETLILYADLLASAYFFLSRYEEWIRKDTRDEHGRFPGKESIAYKEGFLNTPIVDEYGKILRELLTECGVQLPTQKKGISKIYLTHDVDSVARYRTFNGFLKGVIRHFLKGTKELKPAIESYFGKLEDDIAYTYPWFVEQFQKLKHQSKVDVECIFFYKALLTFAKQDEPNYDLLSDDLQEMISMTNHNLIQIGLHSSYLSGESLESVAAEKEELEIACGCPVYYNRNHFLRSLSPEDMYELMGNGITDDFTMGYPDVAGFRIGTCKPVKWINPATKSVEILTLHHLTVMDITLKDKRYMNLNFIQAKAYIYDLIDKIKQHHGEVILLWHNTSLIETDAFSQKKLYEDTLSYLREDSNT